VRPLSERTLYEVLEVARSATPAEVQRAYERTRALFGPGSLASYALLAPGDAQALARRIEEAREVLLDPQARARYDARLPPEREGRARPGVPEDRPRAPAAAGVRPPAEPASAAASDFRPPEGTAWTGGVLRMAREARGLSVLQVSERTKVQRSHIESVEAERFDLLPPAVYLRGIVLSIAAALRLDDQAVARSYMERAAQARATVSER
jgi:curved DNA-binding protein CbpA